MKATSRNFADNAHRAMQDPNLQQALGKMKVGFVERRAAAAEKMPEFEDLRDQARDIKDHVLDNIDFYLEAFEEKVTEQGGQVHWARNAKEACDQILEICQSVDAKMVTKGKSMVAEEIALNDALEAGGLEVVETDPGLKGDTATGGSKPATLSTGAVVRVPLFLNQGEKIRVDTRTREYISRAKAD